MENDFKECEVIFIIGPTAVGKTKLSIEIAQNIEKAEIINADALQLYSGLNHITNKIDESEMLEIPHHLFSVIKEDEDVDLRKYVKLALSVIHGVVSRDCIPIIVGGTNLYFEALLYRLFEFEDIFTEEISHNITNIVENSCEKMEGENTFIEDKLKNNEKNDLQNSKSKGRACATYIQADECEKYTWRKLHELSEENAKRIHPNDHYRIKQAMKRLVAGSSKNSESNFLKLRFEKHKIIFLDCCDRNILKRRVHDRSSEMIHSKKGLVELFDYYKSHGAPSKMGVSKAIGVAEFYDLFKTCNGDLNSIDQKELNLCVEKFSFNTYKYAMKQTKWIYKRICTDSMLNFIKIDTSDISLWDEKVKSESLKFLYSPSESMYISGSGKFYKMDENKLFGQFCDVCTNKYIMSKEQWIAHSKSRSHRRKMKRKSFTDKRITNE